MKQIVMTVLALIFTTAGVQAAETKIGYLDIRQAIFTSEAGKSASNVLQAKIAKFKEHATAKQADLNALKNEIEKQGIALNESTKANKLKEYNQKQRDLERFIKDNEEELKKTEEELINKIELDIIKQVREYGKQHGYTIILELRQTGAVYADKSADVTEAVIKLLNAAHTPK